MSTYFQRFLTPMAPHLRAICFVDELPLLLLLSAELFLRTISSFRSNSLFFFGQVTIAFFQFLGVRHALLRQGQEIVRVLTLLLLVNPSHIASSEESIYFNSFIIEWVQIVSGSVVCFFPVKLKNARKFL